MKCLERRAVDNGKYSFELLENEKEILSRKNRGIGILFAGNQKTILKVDFSRLKL